eukprot:TRINITY_DN722_c2_g1_i1.p1 TRINITY_DN722_c2_g1~~TRINITY_DN722_c2_g1_i1.p1  ORF type:complete len:540 (+),score=143.87 TRINITY_DN722_c2_g1_i1:165-1622(+)
MMPGQQMTTGQQQQGSRGPQLTAQNAVVSYVRAPSQWFWLSPHRASTFPYALLAGENAVVHGYEDVAELGDGADTPGLAFPETSPKQDFTQVCVDEINKLLYCSTCPSDTRMKILFQVGNIATRTWQEIANFDVNFTFIAGIAHLASKNQIVTLWDVSDSSANTQTGFRLFEVNGRPLSQFKLQGDAHPSWICVDPSQPDLFCVHSPAKFWFFDSRMDMNTETGSILGITDEYKHTCDPCWPEAPGNLISTTYNNTVALLDRRMNKKVSEFLVGSEKKNFEIGFAFSGNVGVSVYPDICVYDVSSATPGQTVRADLLGVFSSSKNKIAVAADGSFALIRGGPGFIRLAPGQGGKKQGNEKGKDKKDKKDKKHKKDKDMTYTDSGMVPGMQQPTMGGMMPGMQQWPQQQMTGGLLPQQQMMGQGYPQQGYQQPMQAQQWSGMPPQVAGGMMPQQQMGQAYPQQYYQQQTYQQAYPQQGYYPPQYPQ